jgi:DNA-binding transcriptional MerR regulator
LAGRSDAPSQHRQRPPKLYRIGEVVAYSGVSRQTIHNYATMGLIRESRWTGGGHRLFDESVFERLDRIAEMKAASKSLQDIRDQFARLDASNSETASPPIGEPAAPA